MSNFVARVEMHGASEADYTNLHRAMERAGYGRYVIGEDGKTYQLPTATYVRAVSGVVSASVIRDQVKIIADGIRQNSWVLINRYDDCAWSLVSVNAATAA